MKLLKDLLYDHDNKHLDIARLSALLSIVAYLGMSVYTVIAHGSIEFDFFEWASGWAALSAGNAAFIYARQRIEARMDFTPMNARQGGDMYGGGGGMYGNYGNYNASGYGQHQGYNYNDEDIQRDR